MKNILILFLTIFYLFFSNSPAQSVESNVSCTELNICPSVEKVNGPISSFLSNITGMNFLVSGVLESQIKNQMDKALNSNFKVNIKPFGGKTLLQGKFKSFTAHSDYASIDGFFVSNVNVESLCNYNHFVYKDGKIYTGENFLMGFSLDITSADLQKMLQTDEYQGLLNSMNLNIAGVNVLKVFNPQISIESNRLNFSLNVISPMTLGKIKTISSTLTMVVSDGKILFTDLQTNPKMINTKLEALLPLLNNLNPFTIKVALLENKDSSIKIKSIDFIDNKIVIKGLVIVPKNYYNN